MRVGIECTGEKGYRGFWAFFVVSRQSVHFNEILFQAYCSEFSSMRERKGILVRKLCNREGGYKMHPSCIYIYSKRARVSVDSSSAGANILHVSGNSFLIHW